MTAGKLVGLDPRWTFFKGSTVTMTWIEPDGRETIEVRRFPAHQHEAAAELINECRERLAQGG